ncbi:TPA: flavoprotein [Raoultella planticola]
MNSQRLSQLLDTIIDNVLAQRQRALRSRSRVMRVVLSGEDLTTLPATLDCLSALDRSGYLLVIAFSHSATQSSLHTSCLEALARRGVHVLCDNQAPAQTAAAFNALFLPALSTNSLSKIALGLRDNLVCRWAFHALSLNKPTIVTLNAECRQDSTHLLPPALRARLTHYLATLAEYGVTIIGQPGANPPSSPSASAARPLITRSDVRRQPKGAVLHIDRRTLITPAARDELRDRGITLVESHQEEICIWQK